MDPSVKNVIKPTTPKIKIVISDVNVCSYCLNDERIHFIEIVGYVAYKDYSKLEEEYLYPNCFCANCEHKIKLRTSEILLCRFDSREHINNLKFIEII